MLKEFREFAIKGNVVDLAVGVIIGGAFQKIVDSLVNDIIMPPISALTGKVNFADKFITLNGRNYATLADAKKASAPVIGYGAFINQIIVFIIIAFVVFLLVKAINSARTRFMAEEAAAPAAPTLDQQLLTEIRDALKTQSPA